MISLQRRLRAAEARAGANRQREPLIALFWNTDLVPCAEHSKCALEPATGEHHLGVIHLSFEGPNL